MSHQDFVMQDFRKKKTSINLQAVGQTSLIIVPEDSFIEDIFLRPVTVGAGVTVATVRIGRAAAGYSDWFPLTPLAGVTSTGICVSLSKWYAALIPGIFVAGSEIKIDVTVASIGVLVVDAYVRGFAL